MADVLSDLVMGTYVALGYDLGCIIPGDKFNHLRSNRARFALSFFGLLRFDGKRYVAEPTDRQDQDGRKEAYQNGDKVPGIRGSGCLVTLLAWWRGIFRLRVTFWRGHVQGVPRERFVSKR